jgi:aspartate racemase
MKTVGIIGGLGPTTSSRFYLEVIFSCEKHHSVHRPPILMWNVPITYQAELEEITHGTYSVEMPNLLLNAAKILENAGADFLVMPCNSSHTFFSEIVKSINIPMLNIVGETIHYLKQRQITKVGLISTLITRNSDLYTKSLIEKDILALLPTDEEQTKLNQMILKLTSGIYGDEEKIILSGIIDRFYKIGIQHVVLACAALEILSPQHNLVEIHDTLKILVDATVKEIIKPCQ